MGRLFRYLILNGCAKRTLDGGLRMLYLWRDDPDLSETNAN
jgi:hypothetical protein